ncbi:hypothetical protein RSAG8_13376, partial [Rhizoctonia solani AG-8 WAC10335]
MRVIFFVFAVLAIVLGVVDAREDRVARLKRTLLARQTPFNGPTTVTTTRTVQTFAGTVVETCTITLTPVVANGQTLVREEKNCSTRLLSSSSSASPSTASATSATQSSSSTTTSKAATSSATSSAAVSQTSSAVTTSVTSSAASSASTTSVAITSTTSSVVATSTSQPVTSSAAQATSSSAPAGGPAKEIGTQTVSATSPPATTTVSASAAPDRVASSTSPLAVSATPAQAEASPSTTQFTLPGKKLEVLPIGLGVFAGISVIALIVVGLVTYERTKYRKAFRQRKLAEQGAGMGYSGMSQRV